MLSILFFVQPTALLQYSTALQAAHLSGFCDFWIFCLHEAQAGITLQSRWAGIGPPRFSAAMMSLAILMVVPKYISLVTGGIMAG